MVRDVRQNGFHSTSHGSIGAASLIRPVTNLQCRASISSTTRRLSMLGRLVETGRLAGWHRESGACNQRTLVFPEYELRPARVYPRRRSEAAFAAYVLRDQFDTIVLAKDCHAAVWRLLITAPLIESIAMSPLAFVLAGRWIILEAHLLIISKHRQ